MKQRPNLKQVLKKKLFWQFTVLMLLMSICSGWVGFDYGKQYAVEHPEVAKLKLQQGIALPASAVVTEEKGEEVLQSNPKETYREGYNCMDFAWDAFRALQWAGVDAVVVRLDFEDSDSSHAVIAYPTTDSGWVFKDPQTNDNVYPAVGKYCYGKIVSGMYVMEINWIDAYNWMGKLN